MSLPPPLRRLIIIARFDNRRYRMTEKQKEDNIEVLNDIISEARNAIDNIDDYDDVDIDNVQQNFMRIEGLVQDLSI